MGADRGFRTIDLRETAPRVFATQLSLMHGPHACEETADLLAFQAVFFDQIVIPDSYIHCYGPLFGLFSDGLARPKHLRNRAQQMVLTLIEHGVILVAYRERLSSYDNWSVFCKPRGNFLWLNEADAKTHLEKFDFINTARAFWPFKGNFSAEITDALVANRASIGLFSDDWLRSSLNPLGDSRRALQFVDDLQEFLEHKRNAGLSVLSGEIEGIVEKALAESGGSRGSVNIYMLAQSLTRKRKSPLEAAALQVLYLSKGVSEDLFAKTFNAHGWRVPHQMEHIRRMYRRSSPRQIGLPDSASGEGLFEGLGDTLNIRQLTSEDVLEIRGTETWAAYRASFSDLLVRGGDTGNTPSEVHDEFARNLKALVREAAVREKVRTLEEARKSMFTALAPPAVALLGEALHFPVVKWVGAALTVGMTFVKNLPEDARFLAGSALARSVIDDAHTFVDRFNRGLE